MKAAGWIAGCVAVLLVLISMGVGVLISMGSQRNIVAQATMQDTVPQELRPLIKDAATKFHRDYPWLAAYIYASYGAWATLPLSKRPQIQAELTQERCQIDKTGQEHCRLVRPDRPKVEAEWVNRARSWLSTRVSSIGSEADEEGKLAYGQRDELHNMRDAIAAYEEAHKNAGDAAGWDQLSAGEDYSGLLGISEWQYQFPVLGGGSFSDDWHQERPQNDSYKAPDWHQGTDVLAPEGTPVLAVCTCIVQKSGWNKLGGWTIELKDPLYNLVFYYAHLRNDPSLMVGSSVNQSQQIAAVGHTGESQDPGHQGSFPSHLHFGVYTLRGVTNPYPYLKWWLNGA